MNTIFKTVASADGKTFVLSDETLDSYGDIVSAGGWDLKRFLTNPVTLFAHDNRFLVGTWGNVRVSGGKLLADLTLAARGTSARIDELISLVEQKILRAVSVGFRPLEYEPIDPKQPYGGVRYLKQELLEASLVAVPANPNALQVAKALNISNETMSLAFGEQAGVRLRGVSAHGKQAASPQAKKADPKMKTLSQRIEDAQTDLTTKKDALTVLLGADDLDADAIDELNQQIEKSERTLTVLKASEARIGAAAATTTASGVAAPAVFRRPLGVGQKDVKGLDLVVRGVVCRALAFSERRSIGDVLKERYPDHEATAIICKADQTLGTTTVSGWASELVQTAYGEFVQALTGYSIYPALRDRGIGLSFDSAGNVTIPGRTAGGAGGGFVGEGQPIRVGRITTNSVSMSPRKMGVIIPFSRELGKRSTPAIEGLIRQAILEDTSAVLDPLLLDATAGDTVRPAGLLNGVSAVSTGYAGADYQAVIEDFKALLAPFIAANAADGITVIMNPTQGLNLALMPGPVGQPNWFSEIQKRINIVESTHATAGRLIALRSADFATALGGEPEFDVSEQATIHMEDTTPLEIVSGTGPTTADPVRSLWQTASIGVRMLWDISWKMRRTGMVQWINGTTW